MIHETIYAIYQHGKLVTTTTDKAVLDNLLSNDESLTAYVYKMTKEYEK